MRLKIRCDGECEKFLQNFLGSKQGLILLGLGRRRRRFSLDRPRVPLARVMRDGSSMEARIDSARLALHTTAAAAAAVPLRLSPIGDPFGNPNPKWISNTIPIASNRVPIQKIHFGYQERHNPNLGILSP